MMEIRRRKNISEPEIKKQKISLLVVQDLLGDAESGRDDSSSVPSHIHGLHLGRKIIEIDALGEKKSC